MKRLKKIANEIYQTRKNRTHQVWDKANNQFNPKNNKLALDINEKTGELLPKDAKDEMGNKMDALNYWNQQLGGNWNENDIKEPMKVTVTKTDSNGKQTQSE